MTSHVESKKNDTDELIYKTATDFNLWLPKGRDGGRNKLRVEINIYIYIYILYI